MAARLGIHREDVIEAAVELLEELGDPAAVSLGLLAQRVGVRPQSLYAHVDGASGLRKELACRGLDALAEAVTGAAIGLAPDEALAAVVRAHFDFALTRPGLYAAAIHPPGDDPVLRDAVERVGRPLETVLRRHGVGETGRVHWTRTILATVYGFMLLQRDGQLTRPVDAERTVDHMVTMLTTQVERTTVSG
ncbi:MAG: TetR/AcrR family transcriptional regulator [Actinobacteria bacterium]|nr:TetR/AcrR family transcriptional regulator [Actinomycetota bacterium]NIS37175.1 TetR/AcrR family transcriptional regulator [Actinomycetota bacterium]NIT99123.1 TetR/AcrR family transcriptional regulator [Actinomycetota bacterium]NIU22738.1 TetR/AcrR family transcriptional regulator [Actinomycetota bacterium]NIU71621.1 TetR/AcrR family transcriptional regulator [Actinomycetota bacterium]